MRPSTSMLGIRHQSNARDEMAKHQIHSTCVITIDIRDVPQVQAWDVAQLENLVFEIADLSFRTTVSGIRLQVSVTAPTPLELGRAVQ